MASSEPANTCNRHQPTQKQKGNPDASAQSCKLSVASRVQFPYAIQDCSPPNQRSSSKAQPWRRRKTRKCQTRRCPQTVPDQRPCLPRWFSSPSSADYKPECQMSLLSAHPNQTSQIMNATEHNPLVETPNLAVTQLQTPTQAAMSPAPKLGALASVQSSLARIPDGSRTARCIHGVGLRLWRAVRVSAVARPSGDHVPCAAALADGDVHGARRPSRSSIRPGENSRARTSTHR